ncbi:MAG: signal peptide peptidase SppA [Deltaproteobacteria bacterium]|nr:signal peptide peptidase SppA [Deltaproteobacteria bacterium]
MKNMVFYLIIFSLMFQSLYAERDEFPFYNRFNPYASVYNSLSALDNPAVLGFLRDNQFSLFYQESYSLDSKYYGSVIEFGNLGIGVNYSNNKYMDYLKYSLPVGFRAGDYMLMGFGLSVYDPIEPRFDISWDWYAGAYFMPARFLNISVVGQNLGQPSVGNLPVMRRVNLGLGIKPFSEALELYGDFSYIEHGREIPNRYFVALNPVKGLRLFFGINEDRDMYGGMNLDLTKFGFGFSGGYSDSENGFDGKGFTFRYSGNNYEELFTVSKQIVVVRLDSTVSEGVKEDFLGLRKKGRSLLDVVNDISSATSDNSVAGMYLYISDINISAGSAGEIRRALTSFRNRGKKVVAFLESGDDITYYIANSADSIVINEGGSLILKGGAVHGLYFRNFFEKIGLRFDVVAAGEYKTAFEPLVSDKASEKRAEQTKQILSSVQKVLDDAILSSRGIDAKNIEKIYSSGLFSPEKAKEFRLVDDISTFEQVRKNVKYYFGKEYGVNQNYSGKTSFNGRWQIKRKIAVIYLNGDIVYGKGFGDSVGFETIGNLDVTEIVNEIIKDESIAGVILRINSPGGSTMASQLIFEEIKRIKEVKPLIVSVGSMAASGGYFSAIASDYIVADEISIVGSIGVFFLKPDLSGLLKKAGITYESQKTRPSSDSDSIFRGISESELKSVKGYIDDFYSHFKEKVSVSRKIDIGKISDIAEGRVFTGYEAKSLGLVDEIGGYDVAIQRIKSLAGIPSDSEVEFVEYSRKNDFSTMVAGSESFSDKIINYVLKERKITDFVLYRYYAE